MGLNLKGLLSTLKGIAGSGLRIADIGAKANVPVLSQIDFIADSIKDIKGKRRIDIDAIEQIIEDLRLLKTDIPLIVSSPKKALESNRFKMTLIGIATAVLVHYGFPPDIADQAAQVIFYLVGAYVLGDTLRQSIKP